MLPRDESVVFLLSAAWSGYMCQAQQNADQVIGDNSLLFLIDH